ncbi:MAG: hypothetical protein Q9187_000403 [Circinaria calcarea]
MGFIYSRASLVMVILSPLSFDAVKEMSEGTVLKESTLEILEQDEWNRSVWTYQEIVNSQQLQFVCGSRTGLTVDREHFLNCVGSALRLYTTKHKLDIFTVYERFPNLSAFEDIMLDSLIGGYTQRSALQILSNFHRRSYAEPRNYFYAMIGAMIQEPISWDTGNTVSDIAEAFMAVCEQKNDYSFIYTSVPRAETPGKRWSPLPGILPAILPWHVIDLDGAQRGHRDSQGFWLDEMMTLEPNKYLGDAAKEKMLISLPQLTLAELSDSVIAERIYSALKRIGFTGRKEYSITEAGLFFPQETLPEDSEVKFLVATRVRWAFGAPGLACVTTTGPSAANRQGVFGGIEITYRKPMKVYDMIDQAFDLLKTKNYGDIKLRSTVHQIRRIFTGVQNPLPTSRQRLLSRTARLGFCIVKNSFTRVRTEFRVGDSYRGVDMSSAQGSNPWIWSEPHNDYYRIEYQSNGTWNYIFSKTENYTSTEESRPQTITQNPRSRGDSNKEKELPLKPSQQSSYHGSASRAITDSISSMRRLSIANPRQAPYTSQPAGVSNKQMGKQAVQGYVPQAGYLSTSQLLQPYGDLAAADGMSTIDDSQPIGMLRGTEGTYEKLDPAFKIVKDHRNFFCPGRVFATSRWEPIEDQIPEEGPEVVKYGERVYANVRRFIVVHGKLKEYQSICIQISTYGGCGATRKGLNQEEHCIVYTSSKPPKRLEGETKMLKDSIRVKAVSSSEKLDPLSRVNFAKTYPVPHSAKVKEIGTITGRDLKKLVGYWRILSHGGSYRSKLSEYLRKAPQSSLPIMFGKDSKNVTGNNQEERSALHQAASTGNRILETTSLGAGAKINAKEHDGKTALHIAAQSGSESIVQLSLDNGADIQAIDNRGYTALHCAAKYCTITTQSWPHGADIEAKNDDGRTALHIAVQSGSESIVLLLLDNGAETQARDNRGYTALHCAAKESIARLLLSRGTDIEAKDDQGMTALHWAAARGYLTITQLLIENGADLEAKDFEDETVLDWAAKYGDIGILRLLLEKGADMFQFICKEVQGGVETCEPRHAIFQLHWDLLDYCKEELEGSLVLAPLLTVTGSAKTAYATTCEEYMDRYWPKSGLKTLQTLQTALGLEFYETCWSSGLRFTVDLSAYHMGLLDRHVTIKLFGTQEQLAEIAQQLAWLSAVFRVPKYNELSLSDVVLERIGNKSFKMFLLDLQPVNEKEPSCWHPLFVNGVIARGFPIPARQEEVGIELPFEVMTALGRVLYPMEYYDGIILKGPFTALVPIVRYSDSVQWHFIASNTGNERLVTGSIGNHLTDWFETCDFDLLKEARTFLGYCRNAEIHLGTPDLDYTSIKRSDAQSERSRFGFSPKISFSMGSSGQGFFGAMFGSEVVYNRGLRATTKSTDLFLEDRLRRASEQPLLLYDTEKKRGWLIPELSVILHIVHVWASRQEDLSPNTVHDIPHAEISANGGMAAYDAIDKGRLVKVRPEGIDGKPQLFIDVIKSFLTAFESRKEEIITREDSSSSRPFRQPGLRGWDILDIVTRKHIFGRKEVPIMKKTGGKWDLVALENPELIVLFGEGLGEPIKPERHEKLCRTWTPVPEGRDYLIASVRCLKQLAAIHGGPPTCPKLTPHLHWHCPPNGKLWEACEFGAGHGCNRLQGLEEKGFNPPGLLEPDGGVIFGKMGKEDSRCCEPLKRQPVEDADKNVQHDLHHKSHSLIGMPSDPDEVAISSHPTQNWEPIDRFRRMQPTQERKHYGEGKDISIECSVYNGTQAVSISSGEGNDIKSNEHLVFPCSNGEGSSSVQTEHIKGNLDISEVHHEKGKKTAYVTVVPVLQTFNTLSSSRKSGKKPVYVEKEPISEASATTPTSSEDGERPEYVTEEHTMENDETSITSYGNGNTPYSQGIGRTNYHSRALETDVLCRRPGLKNLKTTAI